MLIIPKKWLYLNIYFFTVSLSRSIFLRFPCGVHLHCILGTTRELNFLVSFDVSFDKLVNPFTYSIVYIFKVYTINITVRQPLMETRIDYLRLRKSPLYTTDFHREFIKTSMLYLCVYVYVYRFTIVTHFGLLPIYPPKTFNNIQIF